jgi:N-dimethylarginine dimethylaminohydrolase
MCPPTEFKIEPPINYSQWLHVNDGLIPPRVEMMDEQHRALVSALQQEGVEVELIPPVRGLPYLHATRDVGVIVGDTVVLSSFRAESRRGEAEVAESILGEQELRVLSPDRGFVEGGDVFVDGEHKKLWVGLGSDVLVDEENKWLWEGLGGRTDEPGADFLHRHFGQDLDVVLLRFDHHYTHLDTVFGLPGRDCVLLYEPAFEPPSLRRIRQVYSSIISLDEEEQDHGGANVLPLGSGKVISALENRSVNAKLRQHGFEVIRVPFSEVIKSGGSVRCDTLPLERDASG